MKTWNQYLNERVVTASDVRGGAARITEALGLAYNAVISFKGDLDTMEEIPNSLREIYTRTGKMIDLIVKAKAVAYQSEMELRRSFR